MLNVQETLNKIDVEKLIDGYVREYPAPTKDMEDLTIKDLNIGYKQLIREFIEKLQKVELMPQKDHIHVLVAHKIFPTEFDEGDIIYSLIYLDEAFGEDIESYAYDFSPFSEIMSFYISDNKLTQDNIYELLVDVLNECSFFGFEQEGLPEVKNRLAESMKEIESGNFKSVPADEVFKEFNLEKEEIPEEIEDMKHEIYQKIFEYNKLNFRLEVDKMKGVLDEFTKN